MPCIENDAIGGHLASQVQTVVILSMAKDGFALQGGCLSLKPRRST